MKTFEERDYAVWTEVGKTTEVCSLGTEHEVTVVARKFLGPVVGRRPYSNGYETMMTPIRMDHQGRTYHQHVQIDFFNNISWKRQDDGKLFWPRPRSITGGVIRDVAGKVIS